MSLNYYGVLREWCKYHGINYKKYSDEEIRRMREAYKEKIREMVKNGWTKLRQVE